MNIFTSILPLQELLQARKPVDPVVGFVPTMGALHQGHLALVKQAREETDLVVCSIFVNPIQFNNPLDLEKYPRTLDEDIALLESAACDVVFVPDEKEMYPEPVKESYDFKQLDKVMEGKFRPGHFNGVAVVVRKFFEIINPQKAYFGLKDYQQLQIIIEMVRQTRLPVEIIPCPTIREADGLAMSSRNRRLSPQFRAEAPLIYQTLSALLSRKEKLTVEQCRQWAAEQIESRSSMKVEYLEIADSITLQSARQWDDFHELVACTAVWAGDVRLIDNILIV